MRATIFASSRLRGASLLRHLQVPERRRVVGPELESQGELLDRLGAVSGEIEREPQVVVSLRALRLEPDGLRQVSRRLRELAPMHEEKAQVDVGIRVARVE